MKICPRCQKTYADVNLNFCLEDGAVLTLATDPQETIRVSQAPSTFQPSNNPATTPQHQIQYQGVPQQGVQVPKKKSKAWIWVLLILGAVVVLCGGGLLGTFYYIGSQVENMANLASNLERSSNRNAANRSLGGNKSSVNKGAPESSRTDLNEVDLEIFVKDNSRFGTTSLDNDELTMGAMSKGYYYALAAPANYTTVDSDTRVTVSNPTNAGGTLGYGLIFHSNPLPLQQDYAFLIDAKTGKYRVVRHSPKKEDIVEDWTPSAAINKGTGDNTLEARDADDKVELYINGTMVTSIRNQYGYPNGVVGL
jgi:hypothetical protein